MENHRRRYRWFLCVIVIACIFMLLIRMNAWKQEGQQTQMTTQETVQVETEEQVQDNEKNDNVEAVRRSIVHIAVDQSAGSGMIWEITEDKLVIAASRHLVMQGVEADVTFCNGEMLPAQVLGISQQYDIAFIYVTSEDMSPQLIEEVEEVRKPFEIAWTEKSTPGTEIVQMGITSKEEQDFYEGTIEDVIYVPEFGTQMLRTHCYSKAGMSGGGVFDREGWLLGMITGGEIADSGFKETQLTYSIPTPLIEEEYQIIIGGNRG